jgi:putative transposase
MILASIGRSVSDLKAHLVLTTKYRRKVFTDEMLKRLHVILEDLLVKWDCKLIEFNGEEDHVHALFQYHPDLQLSTLVGNIKSTTSRRLRQEFAAHLSRFYTKDVFWNGSYFIASCGGVTITTLKQYIESQDRPENGDSSSTPWKKRTQTLCNHECTF